MPELGSLGTVRGALGDGRPYRELFVLPPKAWLTQPRNQEIRCFETRSEAQGHYRFLPVVAPTFFFVFAGAFGGGAALLGSSFFSAGSGAAAWGTFGSKLCIENLFTSTLIVLPL